MDKQKQIKEIISKYKLTDKVDFKFGSLVILGHTRKTKEDYANIINVVGEIEEIIGKTVTTKDESKNSHFDFDDEDWND